MFFECTPEQPLGLPVYLTCCPLIAQEVSTETFIRVECEQLIPNQTLVTRRMALIVSDTCLLTWQ